MLDNAGVIQCFGARNRQAAERIASVIGGFSADEILKLGPDEQVMLIEGGKPLRCRQVRHYNTPEFAR